MQEKLEPVPDTINFPKEEEIVMDLWKRIDAFQTCIKDSKDKPRYSFYDGPPFATGLPHYGHILAGTIKDIVPRYAHQSGFHVERRFGWDCHGLPVEYEVDKILNIKGPEDVQKMGIKAYNDECRKIVMRYSNEWEIIIGRLGRWIDFKNDYKTLYPWFMESVWWLFNQLFEKGLVYRGFKIMPFSTACNTPLSNFETTQNYKEVVDPAIIVSFPLNSRPNVSVLAWTTTPWTLPSNLALCVHPEHIYFHVLDKKTNKEYILMEARIGALYKKESEYEIKDKFPGIKLKGEHYEPLFDYFIKQKEKGAFQVLADSYVTMESGTGVVHQAPYFGADDFRICLDAGIIQKDQEMICPIDPTGKFTLPVTDFLGMYVKDADKFICAKLKEKGRLVHSGTVKHSYPFCWRSDTPLIYKAVPSWFIKVESIVDKLQENNQNTYWVPEFVKEKRFANWLRDAHDWAVSRNRYWGTPIPIWTSEDFKEIVCVGSREELEKLTGKPAPEDLHREFVDDIVIPSKIPGNPPLKRVSEVFDCWFESGSMPYAQMHYPFERKEEFEKGFPADFIAEGVDQTRGWFYTLLVISTALFDKAPWKNLVVNGLVLASDGQKMSKRMKNYPDPLEVVNKYGADALRLYLINSPVVRAENLKFKEEGVKDLLKDLFLPWFNAYRFFIQNILRVNKEQNKYLTFDDTLNQVDEADFKKWNIMDQWILSATQSLIMWFQQEMAAYRLYTVIPRLVKFVEQLTNWYVRLNRRRLKGESGEEDCLRALEVFFNVLLSLTRLMAPFTPFITETFYQNLRHVISEKSQDCKKDSIHYLMLPKPQEWMIDEKIERAVSGMQSVVELGRLARERRAIPIKFPLKEAIIIHSKEEFLNDLKIMESYILEELNIRNVILSSNKSEYNVHLKAEPDFRVLGTKYKAESKTIGNAIKALKDEEIELLQEKGGVDVCGKWIESSEILINYEFGGSSSQDFEASSSGSTLVILNIMAEQGLQDEGVAREIINRIQKLRKKAGLIATDVVNVHIRGDDLMEGIIKKYNDFIKSAIKSDLFPLEDNDTTSLFIIREEFEVKDNELVVALAMQSKEQDDKISCRYVNIYKEDGFKANFLTKGNKATILLENPVGCNILNLDTLKQEVDLIFGLENQKFDLYNEKGKVVSNKDISNINEKTLYLYPTSGTFSSRKIESSKPFVRFMNFQKEKFVGSLLLENPEGEELFENAEEAAQFGWSMLSSDKPSIE